LSENYDRSSFIGLVKIVGIKKDETSNPVRNIFSIEVLNTYNGLVLSEIYGVAAGCAFEGKINSTWLVFATTGVNGRQETDYCSGNMEFNRLVDSTLYPRLQEKMAAELAVKLDVLQFLKDRNIYSLNPAQLYYRKEGLEENDLRGYIESNGFAVYEATVEPDLSISNICPLKPFMNIDLSHN